MTSYTESPENAIGIPVSPQYRSYYRPQNNSRKHSEMCNLGKPQTPARQPHHPSGIPTGGQFNSDSAGRGTGKQGNRRQSDILIFIAGIIAWRRVIIISVDIIACVGILRKESQ